MQHFTSPNERIVGPLPRKDILAICSFLRRPAASRALDANEGADNFLDRLAAAARMQ